MKRLIYIISLMTILSAALPLHAVTDKEMEQARVIATQTYLRYANDGSGYLDALHPTTMAELERNLKPKEKENITAFKAIPVPSGYQSWDKQKLVDYWSNTAFSNAGLTAKGKVGKNKARQKLNNMKVAAPAPAETPAEVSAATQPASAPAETPSSQAPSATPAATSAPDTAATLEDAAAVLDADSRAMAEVALDEEDVTIHKASSYTWVWVVILAILVGIVVALVVFASNVMKRNAEASSQEGLSDSYDSNGSSELSDKLQDAHRNIEELTKQNNQLKRKVEALTAEIAKLKALRQPRQNSSQPPIQGIPYPKTPPTPRDEQTKPQQAPRTSEDSQAMAAAPMREQQPVMSKPSQPQQAPIRTIYLGRANTKKIFIRADRNFNIGNSVFRLDTTDGLVGSYKVVNDPSVIEKVANFPAEMLSSACIGLDLDQTEGLSRIVTDSAGTAIFEDGCWKVMRKAKIHYE